MSCTAIGIGGTGARCVEGLVHLCAAGLGPRELYILLVDPDSANGNLERARRTILQYCDCRELLGKPAWGSTRTFSTQIRFGNENEPENLMWSPTDGRRTRHLGDLFQYDRHPKWQDLCEMFYSDFELNKLEWDRGFRGHASVSAPAMALVRDRLDKPPWSHLISVTQNALSIGRQHTFIFASAFGATGAGAFPTIPRILRKVALDEKWDRRSEYGIGGALLLPYIMFESPHAEKEEHAQAKHFLMNTQAALLHYRRAWEQGSPYDSVYYLGAREPDLIDRKEIGGKFALGARDQRNPAHFVELLAAFSALDFYSRDTDYDIVDEISRKCSAYTAAGSSGKFVGWTDLPALTGQSGSGSSPHAQVQLTHYLTLLSAFVDFFGPLMKSNGFEKRRRLSAWYYRHFGTGSLTGPGAASGIDTLAAFGRDMVFPWFCQLHKTSDRMPLHLFDTEFLEARTDPGIARQRGVNSLRISRILHSASGEVSEGRMLDDGYTAIWDNMCGQSHSYSSTTPMGKFWQMLEKAAADYADERYKFTAVTAESGEES